MSFFSRYALACCILALGVTACSKGADSYTMKVRVSKLEGQSGWGPAMLIFPPNPDASNSSLNGGILVGHKNAFVEDFKDLFANADQTEFSVSLKSNPQNEEQTRDDSTSRTRYMDVELALRKNKLELTIINDQASDGLFGDPIEKDIFRSKTEFPFMFKKGLSDIDIIFATSGYNSGDIINEHFYIILKYTT